MTRIKQIKPTTVLAGSVLAIETDGDTANRYGLVHDLGCRMLTKPERFNVNARTTAGQFVAQLAESAGYTGDVKRLAGDLAPCAMQRLCLVDDDSDEPNPLVIHCQD